MHGTHIGMAEGGGGPGFVEECVRSCRGIRTEYFQCDRAIQQGVFRFEYCAEGTAAKFGVDPVSSQNPPRLQVGNQVDRWPTYLPFSGA